MKTSQWSKRQRTDWYVQQAKKHGYRSRAAYKLKQIALSTKLFARANIVVDCGASPGGWLQVTKEMAPRATIVGIDILPIVPIAGVQTMQGDLLTYEVWQDIQTLLCYKQVDVLLCDMSVNLSGVKVVDDSKNIQLYEACIAHAIGVLSPHGRVLCKVFQGELGTFVTEKIQKYFHEYKVCKPLASRDSSSEYYLLASKPK